MEIIGAVAGNSLRDKIYRDLPRFQHMSTTTSTVETTGQILTVRGHGIVVGDKYLTVGHIVDNSIQYVRDPYGQIMEKKVGLADQTTTMYNIELQPIYINRDNDIGIMQIPAGKEKDIPNRFTLDDLCFQEPQLGERVYIVGDPALSGQNVREARVSDIDATTHKNNSQAYFGMDKGLIPGDSGTFVADKHGKVIGLNSYCLGSSLGYAVKIQQYAKYMLKPSNHL